MSRFVAPGKNYSLALTLASGVSTSEAAVRADISQRSVQRKLAKPAFRRLVADLRDELIGRALGRLADNMTKASDRIAVLLDSENPALQLRAARAMLSFGLRLRDSVDLTERIREVERELAEKGVAI